MLAIGPLVQDSSYSDARERHVLTRTGLSTCQQGAPELNDVAYNCHAGLLATAKARRGC
jgi:hypothetical protein